MYTKRKNKRYSKKKALNPNHKYFTCSYQDSIQTSKKTWGIGCGIFTYLIDVIED